MGKWAARLAEKSATPPMDGTDKTAKRGVLSVLAVPPMGGAAEIQTPAPPRRRNGDQPAKPEQGDDCHTGGGCLHLLRRGTCGEPVAAGLLTTEEGFGIVWPPAGFGADCPAWMPRPRLVGHGEIERAASTDALRHAGQWDDEDLARFVARRTRLMRWGWAEADAERLAERLVMRDRDGDPRVSCTECHHHRPGSCGNHRAAGLQSPELGRDLAGTLQSCPGFELTR